MSVKGSFSPISIGQPISPSNKHKEQLNVVLTLENKTQEAKFWITVSNDTIEETLGDIRSDSEDNSSVV